jgi:hypothetical protein
MAYKINQLAAAAAMATTELMELTQLSTTVVMTSTTVSALASDNSYNDSGNQFIVEGFAVNDNVKVTGFTGNVANNIRSGKITALTAGKMTIGGTDGDVIVDDAAGESVTIARWESVCATPAAIMGETTNASTAKTTPVDADIFGLLDSAASYVLKKVTWANAKATLKTYFDTLYASVSSSINVPAQRYAIELANTTDSDPGAGLVKFNNATPTSATELYIDDSTSDSVDLGTYFASLGQTGFLKIQSAADAGEWAIFKWTATTDGTGYWKFTVVIQAFKGTLDDADDVLIEFDSDAAGGSGGSELKGLTFTSDTGSTADSDPGAGLFKWNNATQGSATKLFFDNTTLDSVTITSFFASLSTDGTVFIQQGDDPSRWQLWEIDTATADSGYYDMAVTLLAKSASDIQTGKTCYFAFTKGAASGGGAGTKTQAKFGPNDSYPQASNFPQYDTRGDVLVLDFDGSTDEATYFVGSLNEAAVLTSGLKVRIWAMCTSATSGDFVWEVAFEKYGTDLASTSFDTVATGTGTANGTSGIETLVEITITTIDSLAAGDRFRMRLTRKPTNGSDTITTDVEFVYCEVRTAN